jgi:hypothetical protein
MLKYVFRPPLHEPTRLHGPFVFYRLRCEIKTSFRSSTDCCFSSRTAGTRIKKRRRIYCSRSEKKSQHYCCQSTAWRGEGENRRAFQQRLSINSGSFHGRYIISRVTTSCRTLAAHCKPSEREFNEPAYNYMREICSGDVRTQKRSPKSELCHDENARGLQHIVPSRISLAGKVHRPWPGY